MGEGSDCIVGKTTAGRKDLRMTGNGSMRIESAGGECTGLRSASRFRWPQRKSSSVGQRRRLTMCVY
jgi:hypothetical protein